MKPRLLQWLRCPTCIGELLPEILREEQEEWHDGWLLCGCGERFPLIRGVPRMLTGTLRQQIVRDYPEFFASSGHEIDSRPQCDPRASAETRTQHSFGYEWTRFAELRPEWEDNFWGYLAPHREEFFAGKLVLDAGCGMGRHLYYSSQHAGEAIGVDFSRAVDAAYANTRHLDRAHVVQADLTQLPFSSETFDFVYSLGVLHHTPDPDAALRRLVEYLKPDGDLRIYVYWNLEQAPAWKRALLGAVTAMRQVTTRLPHSCLHGLCYPISLAAWGTFVLPYRCLVRLPWTRRFAEELPLKQYARYSFRVLVNDQFDRFSAPLERRYSAEQVRRWLESVGLDDVTIQPYSGWLGHGRKGVRLSGPQGHDTERRATLFSEPRATILPTS